MPEDKYISGLLSELKEMESSDQKTLDTLIKSGEVFLKLLTDFDNKN